MRAYLPFLPSPGDNVSSASARIVRNALGQTLACQNGRTGTDRFFYLRAAPFAEYQGDVTYFIHRNHLGSTTFLTNHVGDSTHKLLFLPFGQRWVSGGSIRDERFASLEARDSETTLDSTLFRYYHSRLYRWLSPDPVAGDVTNPQSLNRYAYVLNNPTNLIDPLGLDICSAWLNEFDPEDQRIVRSEGLFCHRSNESRRPRRPRLGG